MMLPGASFTFVQMVRLRPLTGPRPQSRPYWKASLRSAGTLDYCLTGGWNVETRIYRWRWLARLAARWHMFAPPEGLLTRATVEPYWPGENIVRFPSPTERQDKRGGRARALAGDRNGSGRTL
jgi:hypothetical protein